MQVKNELSRTNLGKRLEQIKSRKLQMLAQYNQEKHRNDTLKREIQKTIATKRIKEVLDEKILAIEKLAKQSAERLSEDCFKIYSEEPLQELKEGNISTLSIEVSELVKKLAACRFIEFEESAETNNIIYELLKKYPLNHIYLALKFHMEQLLQKWKTSKFATPTAVDQAAVEMINRHGIALVSDQQKTIVAAKLYRSWKEGKISENELKESLGPWIEKEAVSSHYAEHSEEILALGEPYKPVDLNAVPDYDKIFQSNLFERVDRLGMEMLLAERYLKDALHQAFHYDFSSVLSIPAGLRDERDLFIPNIIHKATCKEALRRKNDSRELFLERLRETEDIVTGPSLYHVAENIKRRLYYSYEKMKHIERSLHETYQELEENFSESKKHLDILHEEQSFLDSDKFTNMLRKF